MGISVFPAGGGEFITNDFVIDMNDSSNNVIDLGRTYAAGAYEVSLATGDTSFDIYAVSEDGESVGYTNDATLVTTGGFTQIAVLGVASDERITFAFSGASNDATSEGDATGAGAYLESINPSDLPNIDDTANVVGGNFASDVEFFFESGTVSTAAKNIVRSDSTALVITRPDNLDPALDPWDVRVVNPGVPEPTGTGANILSGTVDAGATPVWQTTSPLDVAVAGQAYSATVVATDADGSVTYSVTSGSLNTGLSLNGSTGVISGTATSGGTFTLEATDEGGNSNDREFTIPFQAATGGSVTTSGNYVIHRFDTSDDFELFVNKDIEYLIVGGGAGGGEDDGGGGGGGGLLTSISGDSGASSPVSVTAGTYAIAVGAGGGGDSNGGDSEFPTFGTAFGGGKGGRNGGGGGSGGTGGGGALPNGNGGSGTSGQGGDGADAVDSITSGGGGAGAPSGGTATGRNGAGPYSSVALGTAADFAGAGGGATDGEAYGNTGVGIAGAGGRGAPGNLSPGSGDDGIVILRYQV